MIDGLKWLAKEAKPNVSFFLSEGILNEDEWGREGGVSV